MFKLCILFFAYLFITLALTPHRTKSSSISSSDDGTISNKSIIELSKHRSKRYSRDSEDRIVGGQYVKDFRRYPFMVFVHRINYDNGEQEFCGGTLISTTHVLTAAHCFKICNCHPPKDDDDCDNCITIKKEDFTLYFGNNIPVSSTVSRKIKKFYLHSEYKLLDLTHKCIGRFDIAVLELSKPVPYSQTIKAIKLPKPVPPYKDELKYTMTSSFFDTKKKCIILGWGKNTTFEEPTPPLARRLKVSAVPLIGYERCINFTFTHDKFEAGEKEEFPTALLCTDTSFCSKCPHNRNGVCHGDSGGPIICDGVQVGVASRVIGDCVGPNIPNIYTRVDINVQWIKSIMSNKYDWMPNEY